MSESRAISRRALLGGALGAAAAASLAACSGGGASSTGKSGGTLSLMVFGPTPALLKYLNHTILPEFKRQAGISVQLQQSDWGSAFQKLLTAAASSTLPDVTMLGEVMTPSLASKNVLLPIDDYLKSWKDRSLFYDSFLKDGEFGGKSYAVPFYADTRTPVYRTDILQKVGVSSLPTTWDEYHSLAHKLSNKNGGPLATPVDWSLDKAVGLMQAYSQLFAQAGGSWFGKDGKAQFSSEAGLSSLNYLVGFFKEGLASPNEVYQGTGAYSTVSGASAMSFGAYSTAENAQENDPAVMPKIAAGVPLRSSASKAPVTLSFVNKLAISAKTKNRDGAWSLVQFLAAHERANQMTELYGGLPVYKDLANASYLKSVSPGFAAASKYAVELPHNPNLLQIQKEIDTALQQAVRQSSTPHQVLAQIDQKLDAINGK